MKNPLHQTIKDYRIVSIAGLVFISYLFLSVTEWIMSVPPDTLGQGVAVTGVYGALTGAWKFTLDFARTKNDSGSE